MTSHLVRVQYYNPIREQYCVASISLSDSPSNVERSLLVTTIVEVGLEYANCAL